MRSLIACALVLVGCGDVNFHEPYYVPPVIEDAQLSELYWEFMDDYGHHVNPNRHVTEIKFAYTGHIDDDKRPLGYCRWYSIIYPTYTEWKGYVTIDPRVKDLDYSIMRAVVFHELGHCALGLSDQYVDPTDLMYGYIHTDDVDNAWSVLNDFDSTWGR